MRDILECLSILLCEARTCWREIKSVFRGLAPLIKSATNYNFHSGLRSSTSVYGRAMTSDIVQDDEDEWASSVRKTETFDP